jgi:hypothetical protein
MKVMVMILAIMVFREGCVSYRGGSWGPDITTDAPYTGRGTTGVGCGADPGPEITGSEFVPR